VPWPARSVGVFGLVLGRQADSPNQEVRYARTGHNHRSPTTCKQQSALALLIGKNILSDQDVY